MKNVKINILSFLFTSVLVVIVYELYKLMCNVGSNNVINFIVISVLFVCIHVWEHRFYLCLIHKKSPHFKNVFDKTTHDMEVYEFTEEEYERVTKTTDREELGFNFLKDFELNGTKGFYFHLMIKSFQFIIMIVLIHALQGFIIISIFNISLLFNPIFSYIGIVILSYIALQLFDNFAIKFHYQFDENNKDYSDFIDENF